MGYPVIYRKSGPPGQSKGPVIWLRDDMRGNVAVLEHELTHVRQWVAISLIAALAFAGLCFAVPELYPYLNFILVAPILHPVLYVTVPAFRLWCEVQAYRTQISFGGDALSCATSLSQDYGLKLTQDNALARLRG